MGKEADEHSRALPVTQRMDEQLLDCQYWALTVTFLSKKALSVSDNPLIISVRNSVWAV